MRPEDKSPDLPQSYDELRLLYLEVYNENMQLRKLLEKHHILYQDEIEKECSPISPVEQQTPSGEVNSTDSVPILTKRSPLDERISLFMTLFQGRSDVFARQWRGKEGKVGYSPVCKNEWKTGVCGKPKIKCAQCSHADYAPYNAEAVQKHLSGQHVLGIYPLLTDDACSFLAIDFDEENWRRDVQTVRSACNARDIPCSIEISRSGNGAHLWFFFETPIQAALARNFGSMLLTEAMRENARMQFSSYDRMFPNQDSMPKGGFGNLIALPFQREAFKNGGSIFVDESLHPYPDQWTYLSTIKRISLNQIGQWMSKETTSPLGDLRDTEAEDSSTVLDATEKPWTRKGHESIAGLALPSTLRAIMANGIYLPTDALSQRVQNRIKRIAAFRNPEFYKAQAMRMPIWNKPRIICCAEYEESWLHLPRGCCDEIDALAAEGNMVLTWKDERCPGKAIDVSFCGKLREEQQAAFDALTAHEDGVLSATTAFGKTVIGAALIGHRKVNTLILVHRAQLALQWKERLSQFLELREQLPEVPKKRGRKKKRELIGQYGSGRDTRSGIIDIALLQSLGNADAVEPWIGDYGMVIVDECHHVPAISFEQALKSVRAQYVYGLTATPTRQDGHHPILHMYLGPIRYRVDAKSQAEKRPFAHLLIPRFMGTRFQNQEDNHSMRISEYYARLQEDDLRNHSIVDDVLACVHENRNCLILSERTAHVHALAYLLRQQIEDVMTLTGGKGSSKSAHQLEMLKNAPADKPLVICATGKYIGEGFDEARLDTLFLTMPVSWKGTVAQYAGRLHRLHTDKRDVRIYDYVDINAPMLERMYYKRLKGYAAIGYQVSSDSADMAVSREIIYDQNSFQSIFLKDLSRAQESIYIVSPYASVRRIRWLESLLFEAQWRSVKITILTRPPSSFQGASRTSAEAAHSALSALGVHLQFQSDIHQKYAVIDGRIVWYGSINFLSFGASQESIMRLVSSSIANALQKRQEGKA